MALWAGTLMQRHLAEVPLVSLDGGTYFFIHLCDAKDLEVEREEFCR